MSTATTQSITICVTGGTGFIASHIIKQLLELGHTVRATVRDPTNTKKCGFLLEMAQEPQIVAAGGTLTLFKADLLEKGSFDEAFANGCQVVIHTAAVVKSNFDTEPYEEIISPAVDGATEVATAAARQFRAGLSRIVQTSSVSAVHQPEADRRPAQRFQPFTESEWRLDLRPSRCAYEAAKVLSERAVNEIFPGEVIAILPSFTLGPMLCADVRSTLAAVRLFAHREMPLAPANRTSFVDVRDVAAAHVRAALADSEKLFSSSSSSSQASSRVRRFICSQKENRPLLDVGISINKMYYPKFNCPETPAPWSVLWAMSWFDRRISSVMLDERCMERPAYDTNQICLHLDGFAFKHNDFDQMIKDCVESMMKFGVLKPKVATEV